MKLFLLLSIPFYLVWLVTKNRRAMFRWLGFCAVLTVQFFSLLPVGAIIFALYASVENETDIPQNTVYVSQFGLSNWQPIGKEDYPLRVSWYDPKLGGTNCDTDCTTMASGDKVAAWVGGKNGVYAAACPRSNGWHHGKQFILNGITFECRDTGGWIRCYQPGDLDLAIANAQSKGYLLNQPVIAETNYCWVDLMTNTDIPYGTLTYNWQLK